MPKLKRQETTCSDLQEYLAEHSDFSFELSVLKLLRQLGLECEHGGLYEDPVTRKSREFDIRALAVDGPFRVRLPVECKNVKPNFPVLVSCVPRHESESYHQVAFVREPKGAMYDPAAFKSRAEVLSLDGPATLYPAGEPVGKSIAQVGRTLDDSLSVSDSEIHEKWGQALSSAQDMLESMYDEEPISPAWLFGTLVPFVVVPNDRLWAAYYDENGDLVRTPEHVERCSCLTAKRYHMGNNIAGAHFVVTHMEIVTVRGLSMFVENYLTKGKVQAAFFQRDALGDALRLTRME